MANVFIEEQYMQNNADAIRNRTGKTDLIYPEDMAEEILSIGANVNATESDLAEGVTAYVDGQTITGNIPHVDRTYTISPVLINSTQITLPYNASFEKRIIGEGKFLKPCANLSSFGDAKPEDVASSVTFTSTSGLKVTGKLPEETNVTAEANLVATHSDGSSINFIGTNAFTQDTILRYNKTSLLPGSIALQLPKSEWENNFGDATPEYVATGKTFTSVSGLKSEGTMLNTGNGKYIWEVYEIDYIWEITKTSLGSTAPSDATGFSYYSYMNNADGTFKLGSNVTSLSTYSYINGSNNKSVYLKSTQITGGTNGSSTSYTYYRLTTSGSTYSGIRQGVLKGYISSDSSTAYPDNDIQDNYWYVKVNKAEVSELQLHTWKKYSATSQQQTTAYKQQEVSNQIRLFTGLGSSTLYKTMTFDDSTGNFVLGGGNTGVLYGSGVKENYVAYPYCYYNGDGDTSSVLKIDAVSNTSNNVITSYTAVGTKYYSIKNEPYKKGNYIEDVYSTSIDDYPSDGYQDGYWYVLVEQDSSTSGSSGSSSSSGGLTIKTGTTTSATINTGLSEVKAFFLDSSANSGAGLCTLSYSKDLEYMTVYGRSSYNQVIQRVATSGNSYVSFSGGTVNLIGTGNYAFRSGITYSWVAIGN